MENRNLELLRPFDLEAAKGGARVAWLYSGDEGTFVSGPDCNGCICIEWEGEGDCSGLRVYAEPFHDLRMAPLCWVEGKPVYKGDVLWIRGVTKEWAKHYADRYEAEDGRLWQDKDRNDAKTGNAELGMLTWEPPRQPLAVIEGREVFVGDRLYSSFFAGMPECPDGMFEVTVVDDRDQFKAGKLSADHHTKFSSCSWQPPKKMRKGFIAIGRPSKDATALAFTSQIYTTESKAREMYGCTCTSVIEVEFEDPAQ